MSRGDVLGSVRRSLRETVLPDASKEHPGSPERSPDTTPADRLLACFVAALEELSGHVHHVSETAEAAELLVTLVGRQGPGRILAWEDQSLPLTGIGALLTRRGLRVEVPRLPPRGEARSATLRDLAEVSVGLTGALGGLADTGSLMLASGVGRSRLASLLPPVHVALVSRRAIYESLGTFLAAHPESLTEGSNLVIVTGPSRTADIELVLTRGVHGPKELHVVITP